MEFVSEVLTLKVDGPVATLWLDRVAARNAMGAAFWLDLPSAAAHVAQLSEVRVLVIAARGPHFTVGLDLKELGGSLFHDGAATTSRASSNARNFAEVRRMQDAVSSIARLAIPVVVAVHGYCIGGGVDLICAADIRLCSSDAVFSVRETKVAIVADIGTLQRLPRIVNAGHVSELALTGKDIDAAHAARIGLVNSVHEGGADAVYQAALEVAREIAANSPLAVQGTKAVLGANDGRTIDEGLDFVARWNTLYLDSNDLREAMAAFVEKRAPEFRGD